jgi:hypothetical protein
MYSPQYPKFSKNRVKKIQEIIEKLIFVTVSKEKLPFIDHFV